MSDNNGSGDPGNPAAGAGGQGDAGAGGGGDPPASWFAGFEDPALRGLAETKGWKSPEELAKSYRGLESHLGVPADRLIKLGEGNVLSPEDRQRLGLAPPATPEEYGIQTPEGMDPTFATEVSKVMLELGLTKSQAEGLVKWNNDFAGKLGEAETARKQVEDTNAMNALKAEWGGEFDTSSNLARRAGQEVMQLTGMTAEQLSAMEESIGTAQFLKMFAAIGSKYNAEAPFHDSGNAGQRQAVLSPDAAKSQIEQLKGDADFTKKLMEEQDRGVVGPNMTRWRQLHQVASGGQ